MKSYKIILVFIVLLVISILFQSQTKFKDLIDEFDGNNPYGIAEYNNLYRYNKDFGVTEGMVSCPDSTVYIMSDFSPASVIYPVDGAEKIQVSFYSSSSHCATESIFPERYFLGENMYSSNLPQRLYLYDGFMYMKDNNMDLLEARYVYADHPDNIYDLVNGGISTGIEYIEFIKSNKNILPSDLENLGITVLVSEGENKPFTKIQDYVVDIKTPAAIGSSLDNLYYHQVTANIPENTKIIKVVLTDFENILDINGNDISNKYNKHFAALANVHISGESMKIYNKDEDVSSELPSSSLSSSSDISSSSNQSSSEYSSSQTSSEVSKPNVSTGSAHEVSSSEASSSNTSSAGGSSTIVVPPIVPDGFSKVGSSNFIAEVNQNQVYTQSYAVRNKPDKVINNIDQAGNLNSKNYNANLIKSWGNSQNDVIIIQENTKILESQSNSDGIEEYNISQDLEKYYTNTKFEGEKQTNVDNQKNNNQEKQLYATLIICTIAILIAMIIKKFTS